MNCPGCGAEVPSDAKECPECGLNLQAEEQPTAAAGIPIMPETWQEPEQRYSMLRVLQGIYYVLAWIGGLLGVIIALGALVSGGRLGSYVGPEGGAAAFLTFVVVLLGTVLYWVSMMAAAERISVIIDTEENTRTAAGWLRMIYQSPGKPGAQGPPPP
jgi:hypothetical protein